MKKPLGWKTWGLFVFPVLALALPFALQVDWLRLPFEPGKQKQRTVACQTNLRQLALAFAQYAQDNDDALPLPSYQGSSPIGWGDAIYQVTRSNNLFQCPEQGPTVTDPKDTGYSDFYYNGNLAGVKRSSLTQPSLRLLLGEGNDGKDKADATYSKTSLPASWFTDEDSPMFRHQGGGNYLMIDGSTRWLKPDEVKNFGGRKDIFAVK